jgi:hypothetical protein
MTEFHQQIEELKHEVTVLKSRVIKNLRDICWPKALDYQSPTGLLT